MARNSFAGAVAPVLLCCGALLCGGAAPGDTRNTPREQQAEGVGHPPPTVAIESGLFVTVTNHAQVLGAFTVINNDTVAHLMTGFSSPDCSVLRMEQWDGSPPNQGPLELTVPSKGKMVFLRGGYHLHCEKPTRTLNVGDTVTVKVEFQKLPPITAMFQVKPYTTPGVAAG